MKSSRNSVLRGCSRRSKIVFSSLAAIASAAALSSCGASTGENSSQKNTQSPAPAASTPAPAPILIAPCSERDTTCKYPRDLIANFPQITTSIKASLSRIGFEAPTWLAQGAELPIQHFDTQNGPATIAVICEDHYCFNVLGLFLRDNQVVGGLYRQDVEKHGKWFGELTKPEMNLVCDKIRDCVDTPATRIAAFEPTEPDDTIIFLDPRAEQVVRSFYLDCPGGQSATFMDVLRRSAHQFFRPNGAYLQTEVDGRGDEVRIYHQIMSRSGPVGQRRMVASIDAFGELQLYGVSSQAVMLQCLLGKRTAL